MADRLSLIYSLDVPVDFTCRPGGGIDVHYMRIEFPAGVKLESLPPRPLECWPKLSNTVMITELHRLVDQADADVPEFSTPGPDTPTGELLGYVKAEYQESLYQVRYEPYSEDRSTTEYTEATTRVARRVCEDGNPPIAVADAFGNITYICRNGATPFIQETNELDTNGPLNIPYYNLVEASRAVDVRRVAVSSQTRQLNIPLPAIGCCDGDSTTTTTSTTSTTTTTTTTTSSTPPTTVTTEETLPP